MRLSLATKMPRKCKPHTHLRMHIAECKDLQLCACLEELFTDPFISECKNDTLH